MDFNPEDKTVVGLTLGQKVFDRYNLEKVLGQGAMGVVWLATDTVMNEPVALKFLPQVLAADPAALDEMKQEARQARRLTHENIVRIHDIVTDGSMAAISMEWVDGYTLSALRLKKANRVLGIEDLSPLIPQIALGLDYAHHRAKVVHRDLKPSNLMVSQEGDLKITDFGIARSLTDTVTRLTKASTSGTPCYMSPQQMMGKRPDPKDDIYALGATLYELLTGKPPFYTGDLGLQILHAEVVSVSERREELSIQGEPVPESWETAIQQCLSKDPEARFGAAAELVAALGLENAMARPLSGFAGISSPGTYNPETPRPTQGSQRGTQENACPHCGQAVYPEQQFCRHCGGALTEPCPECEFPNPLNTRFCGKCGLDQPAFQALRGMVDQAEEAWKKQDLEQLKSLESPEAQFSTLRGTRSEALKSRLKELQREADSPGAGDAALIQHIQGLIRDGKYKDAQTLMLSPSLPEVDKKRLRGEIQDALKTVFREKGDQVKALIEQDRVVEALELLGPAVENYPREFQTEAAQQLYSSVKKLSTLAALAEAGEFDALKKEKAAWERLEIPPEWNTLLNQKSSDLVWNGVLARAQSKLKANQPSEAYRILSAYEASGLGDDRLETLRPRMEAIRQEVNKALEPEIRQLEKRAEEETLEPALLREEIRRLEVQYLAAQEGGEEDPVRTRLQKLLKNTRAQESSEESEVPPPLPPDPVKPEDADVGQQKASETISEEALPAPASTPPKRKEKSKKSSKGLVLGLVFGVVVPLLIGVIFLVLYLPYQDGRKVLEYVDVLIAEGELEEASLELNGLEATPVRSLFLKEAIAERQTALASDRVVRDYLASIPGFKESFREFRKFYPKGKVEEFTGSWDSLQGIIDRVDPGTIVVLPKNSYVASNPVKITQAVGLVGGESATQITVQVPSDASPLISSDGQDLLLANLNFQYAPTEDTADTMIQVRDGRFGFHQLQISGAPTGMLLDNARGKLVDSVFQNCYYEGLVAQSKGTDITLDSVVFQSCTAGLIIDPGVKVSLVDVEISESSDVGIYASGDFQLSLRQSSINANDLGLEASGGIISAELSTFDENAVTGIRVLNGARISMRDSQANQNGNGLVIANAEAIVSTSEFEGNGNGGIRTTGESSRLKVEQSSVLNNGEFGLKNEMANQVELLDSTFKNNNGTGVLFTGKGTRGILRKCLLFANESHGILLNQEAKATIQACTMSENTVHGIFMEGPDAEADIRGSEIHLNGGNGILVQRKSSVSLLDTAVNENESSGLSFNGEGSFGEVTRSYALRNRRHGVYFGNGADGWIEESRLDQNFEAGILAGNQGTKIRVIRNTVTRNQFGIVVQTGAQGEILENDASGNENAGIGIYSDGSQATVSDNTLENNRTYGLDRTGDNTLNILQENAYKGNLQGDKRL